MDFNTTSTPSLQGFSAFQPLVQFSETEKSGSFYIAALALLLGTAILFPKLLKALQTPQYPTFNVESWDFWGTKAKQNYVSNARNLIRQGFEKYGNKPFWMITDGGKQLMLPPEYIDAVNRENGLSFIDWTQKNFLSHRDTFKGFRSPAPGLFEEAVMRGLTRSLPSFTKPLSEEMASCLEKTWGNSNEWREVDLRADVLQWVARLSARIFVGPLLSEHDEWLRISIQYTVRSFQAVQNVKLWPGWLHWYAELTDPECKAVRADHQTATDILKPILAARTEEIAAAQREGRKPKVPDDSIEWFRNASKGRVYNTTDVQLGLTLAAIHTTSDMIGQTILNLCKYPEIIEPLREEAIQVLSKYGWQKVALTELRLLDSFMKETQRLKPIGMESMHRLAVRDVVLPDGLRLRKGETMGISAHRMWSDDIYADAETFDPQRFLKRRQIPEFQHSSHFVSTSEDHLGFSHGRHACPGRFFAANEVKIAMTHLLLKYDIKVEDKAQANWIEVGPQMIANPFAKISVRRRQEEIDIAQVAV